MTPTTLVTGATARQRETAIATALAGLPPESTVALILEGLRDGASPLPDCASRPAIAMTRIAPGCPCCIGNLTMRVTLNRALRQAPQHLFISLASSTHLEQVRQFLLAAPYDSHLTLAADLRCPPASPAHTP